MKSKKLLIPLLIIFAFLLLTPSFVFAAGSCLCIKKSEPTKTSCVKPPDIKLTIISDLICKNPTTYGIETYLSATIQSCTYYAGDNCTGSQQYTPPAPVQKETPFTPIVPKLQINIPTVQFSNITKEGQMLGIPFLAEYISGVYKYAVAIVSIIAIVMIMVGGLRWMTAGGNASAITSAKETISGATIGLLLVLGSYTVLYTINPDLVSFKQLKIKLITRILIDDEREIDSTVLDTPAGKGSGSNITELIGALPSQFRPCSKEAAQYAADALDKKVICVGPCHCAWAASAFLSYIDCKNISNAHATQISVKLDQGGWISMKITGENKNNLPVGLLLGYEGGHVGVSLGDGKQFDSGSTGLPILNKKYNLTCATTYTATKTDPGGCDSCAKLKGHEPASGKFASKGCKSTQGWTMRPIGNWDILVAPAKNFPNSPSSIEKVPCSYKIYGTRQSAVLTKALCDYIK